LSGSLFHFPLTKLKSKILVTWLITFWYDSVHIHKKLVTISSKAYSFLLSGGQFITNLSTESVVVWYFIGIFAFASSSLEALSHYFNQPNAPTNTQMQTSSLLPIL
jgi:lysozyme family protein